MKIAKKARKRLEKARRGLRHKFYSKMMGNMQKSGSAHPGMLLTGRNRVGSDNYVSDYFIHAGFVSAHLQMLYSCRHR